MRACVRSCMFVSGCVRSFVHACLSVDACVRSCMHVCQCVRAFVRACMFVSVCVRACAYAYVVNVIRGCGLVFISGVSFTK